jgi:hypothetical protein
MMQQLEYYHAWESAMATQYHEIAHYGQEGNH